MAPKEDFKVVIAGAGVAGLTIANMFEKFDIDYVLLESHDEVAPAVGASIGLFANGLRILDQLGLYEAVEKLMPPVETSNVFRNSRGKPLGILYDMGRHQQERHGYPVLFFDRQWLLQALFDNLKHKDKVLLGKRVSSIVHMDGGVKVVTADGDSFSGTILLGADGIHSKVREEMFRLGHQLQPSYFKEGEADRVPCYYQCCFGISQDVPSYAEGETNIVTGHGWSALIPCGPEGRVYWFLFVRLPEPKYGKNMQDEADLIRTYSHVPITDKVTFGDVFAKKLSSTLTPLHEVVFEKWFFRRVIILGDAAHKPNPINGQGGNGALESAAELTNAIVQMRDDRPNGLSQLSDRDIEFIFAQVQSSRHARAKEIVRLAHKVQALNAHENHLISSAFHGIVLPHAGDENVLKEFGVLLAGSSRIKKLPVPHRPRAIPYTDELPRKPIDGGISRTVLLVLVAMMAFILWLADRVIDIDGTTLDTWAGKANLDRPWAAWFGRVGFSSFSIIVSTFSYILDSPDPRPRLQLVYFLLQLISPTLITTVEGYRIGNHFTLLALPSLWLAGFQFMSIAREAPVYALVHAFQCHTLPTGRFVRPEVAKALIPALILGYLIPTALMLVPSTNIAVWQDWTAFWQFAPPLVPLLVWIFSAGFKFWQRKGRSAAEKEEADKEAHFAHYTDSDLPILKIAYNFAFVMQAAAHITTLAYARSNGISILEVFFDLPNPLLSTKNLAYPSIAARIATLLRYDMAISWAAIVMSNLYSVWLLRSQGYVRSRDAFAAAVGVILGQVVVGSGATRAALWHWRETVLAGLKRA